jgi:regulator of cell morphogenesis and NO signaling
MIASAEATVGNVASQFPQTIPVFQRLGIEFCCDGHRRLGDLCRERQLSFEDVAAALTAAVAAPPLRRHDWNARSLGDLTAHIVEAFHEPLRQELPRLREMAARVQRHSAPDRRRLALMLRAVEHFQAGLELHMATAERELFPLIGRLEAGLAHEGDRAQFGRLRAALESDHDEAGRVVRLLRTVTDRYEPPARACATLRSLYQGLKELEQVMQLHVHLENNVLFPRAAALTVPRTP